jgi:transposase-like protein
MVGGCVMGESTSVATLARVSTRTRYSDEQKREALDLFVEVGGSEAGRRTGIPSGTIAAWASRGGITGPPTPEVVHALEVRAVTLADRKVELAGQLRTLAVKATAKLVERIDNDEIAAKDLISALTAAIDRMQLLTGEATARTESFGAEVPKREHLANVVDQLAARRAA